MMLHLPDWMAKWKREGLEWHRKDTEMFEGFIGKQEVLIVVSDCRMFYFTAIDKVKTEMVRDVAFPFLFYFYERLTHTVGYGGKQALFRRVSTRSTSQT